ncbi:MAG: hypothetical protein EP329_02855 [Deltaproteobacteria bacterium]|nr:MAG: hypothetical protein EP329_02855 [Deltaproteobacteria bacterium]
MAAAAAEPEPPGPAAAGVTEGDEPQADPGAEAFVTRCSGCHTIGGGPMKGPDLVPATRWAAADLRVAIKKMEKHVGSLSDADLDLLGGLLKAADVRDRIEAERQRAITVMAATLDPPDPALGEALFTGTRALRNGGLPCSACHRVGARGGALGPDLTQLKERLPRVAMLSAFEGANYPVMRPAYAARPVTKQEAIHLASFFEERAASTPAGEEAGWVVPLGALLALLAVVLIRIALPNRGPAGVRARLVRDAQREAP